MLKRPGAQALLHVLRRQCAQFAQCRRAARQAFFVKA
jgi:hypothetical protein